MCHVFVMYTFVQSYYLYNNNNRSVCNEMQTRAKIAKVIITNSTKKTKSKAKKKFYLKIHTFCM